MKKCILHIHLMDFPSLGFRNGKCQSYGIHLHYWSEGLIIVNTMNLLKSFGDKPSFVSVDLSICCALGPVDPSAYEKFLPDGRGARSQVWFSRRELYSSYMEDSQKGFPIASPYDCGSEDWTKKRSMEGNVSVVVSAIGGSLKSYSVLLVSAGSPMRSPAS
jgi:hypothetical protein